MGRPRSFNEEEVLQATLQTFWSRGFDGTSIDDLTAATGLGRASLYGAFGDKEQMFRRAMEHYRVRIEPLLAAAHTQPVMAWLERFLSATADGVTTGPTGCFLQQATAACTHSRPDSMAWLQQHLDINKQVITVVLQRGVASGLLANDVEAIAEFIQVVVNGMAARARMAVPRASFDAVIAATLQTVRTWSKPER
jgi:AcrR family transcriptional regulator